MSKKVIVLGHVDHTYISQRVIDALTAIDKQPVLVGVEELPEEKPIEGPKLESMMISAQTTIKDGQTNRRERRKQKRLK